MRTTLFAAVPALALLAMAACTADTYETSEGPAAAQSGRADWPSRAAEADLQREIEQTTENRGTTATGTAWPTERLRSGEAAGPPRAMAGAGARDADAAGAMSADDLRARLEAQGYTDVADLRREGDVYRATAMRDGQAVTLQIDPETGRVVGVE